MNPVDIRNELRSRREALRHAFVASPDPRRYFAAHTRLLDHLLRKTREPFTLPAQTTLVAIGGYGRGEQYPHSDVDLLILLPAPPDDVDRGRLEPFVQGLYDVGLDLSPSVRTVEQCVADARDDITLQTALLETRLIHGSRNLLTRLRTALHGDLDMAAFFAAKGREQQLRHHKYQDSAYHLEPNLKEAPGGLRDLQVIRWVTSAAGFGQSWQELAHNGLITTVEARTLRRIERFLQQARIRLHFLASRKSDFIRFEFQSPLAEQSGVRETGSRRAGEVFMQHYYQAAKIVLQLNTILLQNIAAALAPCDVSAKPIVISERFQAVRDLLDIRSPDVFERQPNALLEAFLLLQQHATLKGMTARTLRALWQARRHIDARFRQDPENRRRFLQILQQPRGVVHELRRMNQYGILSRYLPPFRRIVCQMQHDLIHVYTVDQHILTVVRNLRRFTMLEFAHEVPLCTRLMAGFPRHWLLYVAALFHDIAKGRMGEHAILGKRDAVRFCRAHAMSPEDTDLVAFLVEHHLKLSSVAQRQDLADPNVIREFAGLVKTERRLVGLYLLTVADVRGTNPTAWNPWKERLLNDLLYATQRLLRGDAAGPEDIGSKQAEAIRRLRLYDLADACKDALWRELDVDYFLSHDANEIAWQTRMLYARHQTEQPVVRGRLAPIGEGVETTIYCVDQPNLFARLCGIFASLRYNIVEAKIHTTRHGYALDTFLVLAMDRTHYSHQTVTFLQEKLETGLARRDTLPPLPSRPPSRRVQYFPVTPEVSIRPDDKGLHHVLYIMAADRPGLLYDIARVLARNEINVRTAKIVTIGERAEDVFLVEGPALDHPEETVRIQTEMLEVLG